MSAPQQGRRLVPVLVFLGAIALAALVAVLVAAGGGSDDPPAPGSPEQLTLGEEVFTANCQTCHGPEAEGGLAGPPLVHEIYQDLRDADIRTAIAQGVPKKNWDFAGMTPIEGLADHEVAAVIEYVRSRQEAAWGEAPQR